ncbi:MAG: GNAT family N-acetyltransferase [Cyanobacteria bacterium REEB65]|nr:GNAT family N-acetyltransferase [Cyanobacteria bacterium REEB65]
MSHEVIESPFPPVLLEAGDLCVQVFGKFRQMENAGGINDEKGVASYLGWEYRHLLVDGIEMKVVAVGYVVTRPDCRRQGHASHLINRLAESTDPDPMVLFTDKPGFYERLEFEQVPQVETMMVRRKWWADDFDGTIEVVGERW